MKFGLYDSSVYKDNCGFGLIANIEGKRSHQVLQYSIQALARMTHRGGIAFDGKTGDGCGLLLQMPDAFFRSKFSAILGKELPKKYAIGAIFCSRDVDKRAFSLKQLTNSLEKHGFNVLGWRKVPVNEGCLGELASLNVPCIMHLAVAAEDLTDTVFRARLYMAKREVVNLLSGDRDFYVCSLSSQVICYKGLMMPIDLPNFYHDLSDSNFQTGICVFHQRFSTNTLPEWSQAQPFQVLAHNGEINTILGNRRWAESRRKKFKTDLIPTLGEGATLIDVLGSDSESLDSMLDLLTTGGIELYRAIRMLMPPAWQNIHTMDSDLRAFYEYNSMHVEPWDGSAGLVLTDGQKAICVLDRNGLRPSRWIMTRDGNLIVASEVGVVEYPPNQIVDKGRVGPGEVLAVDTKSGELLQSHDIDHLLKRRKPYKKWLKKRAYRVHTRFIEDGESGFGMWSSDTLQFYQKMFQVTLEERDQVLRPLSEKGHEAVGTMGDNVPLAVLSRQIRPIFDYFRQQFAQVTNPSIDSLRESVVMSLETCLGRSKNPFMETEDHASRVILKSPVLSRAKFMRLVNAHHDHLDLEVEKIILGYQEEVGLEQAIKAVCEQADIAVRSGKVLLHLTDKEIAPMSLIIPAAMAVGAVHHSLIKNGLRADANILLETGSARDSHQFAVLIGCGATAIYPYLAYEVIFDQIKTGDVVATCQDAYKAYRNGINTGLLKILSRMGVSTISSYRGAQLFEALGLGEEVINLCFKGVPSRIGGATFNDFHQGQKKISVMAFDKDETFSKGGIYKYIENNEYHSVNPELVQQLHKALETGKDEEYERYATLVNERPTTTLRDLLKINYTGAQIPLESVEPISAIVTRFEAAAMSLGAISPEAHEIIAKAMNSLGGRSNSGEGGEDPDRFGTDRVSKIKQVASGRFGVTPNYLVNADVIQIKIAQGSDPGQGGYLPGRKVSGSIARLRFSSPGVNLISPPSHHDIYSIEDLAQLIYDLKQINPRALISVKLASGTGVGTIAAGVVKSYADLIVISGHDGGTAASALTSIRYTGLPWELGLREVHQTLRGNQLRGRVQLQVDGGLKTGLDVIKAAILGAESFGFGTTLMIAVGCKYLKGCHLNNCATGVATQQEYLRSNHFQGKVENVKRFFNFIAAEVRGYLALLGVSKLEHLVGQTHFLDVLSTSQRHVDLSAILVDGIDDSVHVCQVSQNIPHDRGELSERIQNDCLPCIEFQKDGEFYYKVSNCDRAIGAMLSGEIARRYGSRGMQSSIRLKLEGAAGQSLGAWNVEGVDITLEGEANDYVGKGMAGGCLTLYSPEKSCFASKQASIVGNACLYGATGGRLYATGVAGERFGVRNSGAIAVVEGVGDHCCEYMTGGVVVVLGVTGVNFGAGMTGGIAYVLDQDRRFVDRYNHDLVDIHRIDVDDMESYQSHLNSLLKDYVAATRSSWGVEILEEFYGYQSYFWLVKPKAESLNSLLRHIRG